MASNRFLQALAISFTLGVMFCFALANPSQSTAQAISSECNGVDVAFLIDQSKSMGYNDQNQLRSAAVKTAIDILGDNAIYFCSGVKHRISVIGFGGGSAGTSATRIYLPSTTISPALDALSAWKQERTTLKASIPVTDDLGATDHIAALRAGAAVLQQWSQEPLGEKMRIRMVVLVTDGGPCIKVDETNKCVWDTTEYGSRNGYLEQLKAVTDQNGSEYPWKGDGNAASTYLWIIAFRDANSIAGYDYLADRTLLETWETIADEHGSQLLILPRRADSKLANTDLTSLVANVLDPVLGSKLNPWDCTQPIWINPYVSDVAIIHIFRRGSNPGVPLDQVKIRIRAILNDKQSDTYENGTSTPGSKKVDDYTKDGPNERYVFYFPPPGKYVVEVEGAEACRDLDVRIGENGARSELLAPVTSTIFPAISVPPYYDEIAPSFFSFRFSQQQKDGAVVPLQELENYPLDLKVIVRSKDASGKDVIDEYSLIKPITTALAGIYEARDRQTREPVYIRTPYEGTYTWDLIGTTNNPRAFDSSKPITTPITVIQAQGSFKVVPVEEFGFQVLSPQQDDVVLASDVRDGKPIAVPIQVGIQFTNTRGGALSPADVIADSNADTFELKLYDSANTLIETANLHYDAGAARPTFTAVLRSLGAEESPDPAGLYRLEVNLKPNYVRNRYRPIMQSASVRFYRERLQEFSFEIQRPAEGERFSFFDDGLHNPIQVETQVTDADGKPLSQVSIASPEASPFTVKLFTDKDQLLDTQPMSTAGNNLYVAAVGSNSAAASGYAPGCYKIVTELTNDYRTRVFRPKQQVSGARVICLVETQEFVWQISHPVTETYALHPTFGWFPSVKPLPLVVEVRSEDGQLQPAVDIQKATDEALFTGRLRSPTQTRAFDVTFRPDKELGRFVADWPKEADQPGSYALEVTPNAEAAAAGWYPTSTALVTRTFERRDSLFTKPWSLLALLALVLLLAASAGLIYLASGPLVGASLSFFDSTGSLGDVKISGLLNRRQQIIKQKVLGAAIPLLDLDHIQVKSVPPTVTEARVAVNTSLVWPSSDSGSEEPFEINDVNEGEPVTIDYTKKIAMRLEKTSTGWIRETLWLVILIVAAFAAWVGVVAYLYRTA